MHHRVAAALAIAVIAAGCGSSEGGGEQTSTDGVGQARTTASMTKAQFTAHFNAICRRTWPEILENVATYNKSQSTRLSKQKLFENAVRYSFMAGFDYYVFNGIHTLGAPEQQEHKGTALIFTMKEAVEKAIHRVWLTSPAQLVALFSNYNRAARRYGLDDCLVAGSHLPTWPL